MDSQYTSNLYQYLLAHRDTARAAEMEKYMKNRYKFMGISKPMLERYWKEHQSYQGAISASDAISFAEQCIAYSEREMWYIALDVLIRHKKKLQDSDIHFVENLIVQGDWWDIVDLSASHLIGELCIRYDHLKPLVHSWIDSSNLWLRRTALIYQLKYKEKTDESILYAHILKTCGENDFFIRKAIGWALREYSKLNPASVQNFILQYQDKLSPLSIREGSKYL